MMGYSIHHLHLFCRSLLFLNSGISGEALLPIGLLESLGNIISNMFVVNMAKGHHLQLRCHLPLFHNIRQFKIKAIPAHHSIIENELDELLAKGPIEQSSGGAGFLLQQVCYS